MQTFTFPPEHFPYNLTADPDRPLVKCHVCPQSGPWVSLLDVFDMLNCRNRNEVRASLSDKILHFKANHRPQQRESDYEIVRVSDLVAQRDNFTPTQRRRIVTLEYSASELCRLLLSEDLK